MKAPADVLTEAQKLVDEQRRIQAEQHTLQGRLEGIEAQLVDLGIDPTQDPHAVLKNLEAALKTALDDLKAATQEVQAHL